MQTRFSLLIDGRPSCSANPNHPVHSHGHYDRFAKCDGHELERILRFLCPPCGRTISVLPDHMLPYRPISVPKIQEDFDARARGDTPPPATEKERGCLNRAWVRFARRMAALAAVLGQMVQLAFVEPKPNWLQLRRWGSLRDILRLLCRPFNTSLLHDYLCLLPWSCAPDLPN